MQDENLNQNDITFEELPPNPVTRQVTISRKVKSDPRIESAASKILKKYERQRRKRKNIRVIDTRAAKWMKKTGYLTLATYRQLIATMTLTLQI